MKFRNGAAFTVLGALLVCVGGIACAQSPGDVSGNWSGSFLITMPDGSVVQDKAVLVLHQAGSVLTGSAGAAIDKQSPIEAGKIEAGRITFHLSSGGGMDFVLHLTGANIQGEATARTPRGMMTAALDAARAPEIRSLRDEVVAADGTLFAAYNGCDLTVFEAAFSTDLEFYHDKTGLTDRRQNVEALRQRCGEKTKYRRQLDVSSVEVYPVPGYGAMESGIHSFYERGADGVEKLDATVKFMNLWKKQGGAWKLARVVSYDHR